MKKTIYIIAMAALVVLALGCVGVKTSSQGLENDSFMLFIGKPSQYAGGVEVTVDNNPPFTANVQKDHATRPKGSVYAIATGSHQVSVKYDGQLIYQKQIFVGAQETKKIILP